MPVISPTNKYKIFWDYLIILTVYFFLYYIPLMIVFNEIDTKSLIVLLMILFFDNFLTINSSFYLKGAIITDRLKILHNYFQGRIFSEFFVLLSLIITVTSPDENHRFVLFGFFAKFHIIFEVHKKLKEKFF